MLASFQQEGTLTPFDAIVVGGFDTVSRQIVLTAGQNLLRGCVLGKSSIGAATSAVKASGANTGTGTLTLDGVAPEQINVKSGLYTVRFTAPTTYVVTDPTGLVLGNGAVGTAFTDRIKFNAVAGGTAFVAGDGFDITVAAGSNKYVLSLAAALDGSQNPCAILAEDTNASGGDAMTVAYFKAVVDENALTFGAGQTPAGVRDILRGFGIQLQSSITR